jgi:putative transposase
MDCIHVKVRDNSAVRVKALYLVIGVNLEGLKEVLGLWMAQTKGAKFWLQGWSPNLKMRHSRPLHRLYGWFKGLSWSDWSGVSEAERQLTAFEVKWDNSFAPIRQSWRRNWSCLTSFFNYPPDIRKVIYTTNTIESVNMSLRKITKTRGSFPTDNSVFKLFYLALNNISQ